MIIRRQSSAVHRDHHATTVANISITPNKPDVIKEIRKTIKALQSQTGILPKIYIDHFNQLIRKLKDEL
jgi:hypothetical protein